MNKALMACAVVMGCIWTAAPAFADSEPEPVPPLLECTADSDCSSNELCAFDDGGVCPPCAFLDEDGDGINDVDCPNCTSPTGVCIPAPSTCDDDADCSAGELCAIPPVACPDCGFLDEDGDGVNDVACPPCEIPEGTCVPQVDTCTDDSDCADYEFCDFGDVAVGVGCACPSVDEDGDGENDVACDCPEPAPLPAPVDGVCVEEWDPGTCTADADCGAGEECVIDTQCWEACPAIAGADGEPIPCHTGCEQVSYCAPTHYCGVDEDEWPGEPVPMPIEGDDDLDFGELFGCQAAKSGAPADASLLAMGLFGLVALARRRRD